MVSCTRGVGAWGARSLLPDWWFSRVTLDFVTVLKFFQHQLFLAGNPMTAFWIIFFNSKYFSENL